MADGYPAVAVTGIGVVSPIGFGRQQFWAALRDGQSGIAPIEGVPLSAGLPTIAAQVRNFAAREFIASAHLRRMDRLSRMIVAAGRMACDDAHLVLGRVPPDRIAVVVGSALGNMSESAAHLDRVFIKGPGAASPMIFPNLVANAPASYLAMELGVTGVNLTVAQAEVSSEQAIILGSELVRAGRADVVLAGGGDELAAVVADVYRRAGALSGQRGGPEWCSPYDGERNGIVLGEGAAILVLESAARAQARGAPAYAAISGGVSFAVPAPLYDWPERAAAAVRVLGPLAGGGPVDLLCGSANSSRRLDACEIDLFASVMNGRVDGARVTSIKGAVGEFGGAGALSAAAVCLALRAQMVPPLCNLRTAESAPALRFAARRGEPQGLAGALLCGIARGGAGAALLLQREAQSPE
jgi:3-oxoacyl-[acyl-carrier-protein] synthase II